MTRAMIRPSGSPRSRGCRAVCALVLVLLLGLLVRLPFAAVDTHGSADLSTYRTWGAIVETRGLAAAYDADVRALSNAYPPLLYYLFGLAARAEASFEPSLGEAAAARLEIAIIKSAAMLCDAIAAALLAWALWGRSPRLAVFACALYLFNPAVWYVSTYWQQLDSVYTAFLLASVIALERGRYNTAWAAYALGVVTKVQSLALAPLLFLWSLVKGGPGRLVLGLAAGSLVTALVALPWLAAGRASDIVSAIADPAEPRKVYVSAYNLWYLVFGDRAASVSSLDHLPGLPVSYQALGLGLFMTFVTGVTLLALTARWGAALPAAILNLAMFVLLTQMHERHVFAALAFLLMAAAQYTGDGTVAPVWRRGLWWAYGLLSATFLFNLLTISPFTSLLGGNLVADLLAGDESTRVLALRWVSVAAALLNIGLLAWLVLTLAVGRELRHSRRRSLFVVSRPTRRLR
jgi:Gpi18-like mannosyltransferase